MLILAPDLVYLDMKGADHPLTLPSHMMIVTWCSWTTVKLITHGLFIMNMLTTILPYKYCNFHRDVKINVLSKTRIK
jgi:hypothetical protein